MTRYYLHLRAPDDEVPDPQGREFSTGTDLKAAVLDTARDVMSQDVRGGVLDLRWRVDAVTSQGVVAYSLPFTAALTITPSASAGLAASQKRLH